MDTIDRINKRLAIIGKTGAEMSRDLGLSNSAYSQWNTGKTKPSKKTLVLIAPYLGTTVEYLLTGKEKPAGQIPSGPAMYDQLNEEDKALIDQMIERLYKQRFGDQ